VLTINDVELEVIRIADEMAGDPEVQHYKEDKLHQRVLQAIIDGAPNPVELAKAALQTRLIKFAGWTT
jgi:hypothetical protein